ncbi:MAG TPA: hypothetical protein VNN80_04080 [Polyangiaceae bacterium]|jgi:hypothetical protein|nr:hypothetical protein [Polyangiaceae bacterium]
MRTLRSALSRAAGLSVALGGCGFSDVVVDDPPAPTSEPPAFVMSRMHALGMGGSTNPGYACHAIGAGPSGSMIYGDATNDVWVRELEDGGGLSVEVGSLELVLERRHYGRDFSQSRGVDQFVITTSSGARYQLVYWGGTECERCPPASVEPLPGDPQGCGATDAGGAP